VGARLKAATVASSPWAVDGGGSEQGGKVPGLAGTRVPGTQL